MDSGTAGMHAFDPESKLTRCRRIVGVDLGSRDRGFVRTPRTPPAYGYDVAVPVNYYRSGVAVVDSMYNYTFPEVN